MCLSRYMHVISAPTADNPVVAVDCFRSKKLLPVSAPRRSRTRGWPVAVRRRGEKQRLVSVPRRRRTRGWPVSALRRRPKAQSVVAFRRRMTTMHLRRRRAWSKEDSAVDLEWPGPPLHHHRPLGVPGRTHANSRPCGDAVLNVGEAEDQ